MFGVLSRLQGGLRVRYAEPHRAYHTQAHIDAMLGLMGGVAWHASAAVELAVWYHDAIYDPSRGDNESASAALMRGELDGVAAPALLAVAEALILATASHVPPVGVADGAGFLDMDLSVLGAEAAVFDRYDAAIRVEYSAVPDAEYRAGRARILRSFLGRPAIYLTAGFRGRFEARARENLARAIVALG